MNEEYKKWLIKKGYQMPKEHTILDRIMNILKK